MSISLKFNKEINPEEVASLLCFAPWAENRTFFQIKRILRNSDIAVLVLEDDIPVGFGRVITDFVCRAFIEDVIVHPDYRGMGIGRKVVDELEFLLRKLGVTRIHLTTEKVGFWEKLGYREKKTHMFKDLK